MEAKYYAEVTDSETAVKSRIRNANYVKENLQIKSFLDNGVYISDTIELSRLQQAKTSIEKSPMWNDKKIVENIQSYRFQVRQQVYYYLRFILYMINN